MTEHPTTSPTPDLVGPVPNATNNANLPPATPASIDESIRSQRTQIYTHIQNGSAGKVGPSRESMVGGT